MPSTFRFAAQMIRRLRGGSQPILAIASDGLPYVVKFRNNLQGANLLFNEAMGIELYKAAKLSVPPWKTLYLSHEFLDANRECWLQTSQGLTRPTAGLCFASRYLGIENRALRELLPASYYGMIRNRDSFWLSWCLDICAHHSDGRQALFLEGEARSWQAFFIDHGHLFGGASGQDRPKPIASRYLDLRIYTALTAAEQNSLLRRLCGINVDQLCKRANRLPEEWKTPSALSEFTTCLHTLASPEVLKVIFNLAIDAQRKANHIHNAITQKRQEACCMVHRRLLPPNLQSAYEH